MPLRPCRVSPDKIGDADFDFRRRKLAQAGGERGDLGVAAGCLGDSARGFDEVGQQRHPAILPISSPSCDIFPTEFSPLSFAAETEDPTRHALLADEIRARRVLDRRSRRGEGPDHAVVRRAQLPGAQLHARPDAGRRPRVLLSLELPGAGHRRHRSRSSAPAYPDATQFDRKSPYFDAKATRDAPRWFNVDVKFVEKMRFVSLAELRAQPELARMRVLQRGNRLSITPVDPAEWALRAEARRGKQ